MRRVFLLAGLFASILPGCGGSEFGGRSQGEHGNGGSVVGGAGAGGGPATGGHSTSSGGASETGGSSSSAGAGGAATGGVASGGAGTGGAASGGASSTCGGLLAIQCPNNQWCDYPSATGSDCGSGDVQGTCRDRPVCAPGGSSMPVCGCDGNLYADECQANSAGTDVSSSTSCYPDAGTAGTPCASDLNCGSGLKCCYPCGIPGCQNVCTAVPVGGSCPLYP